MTEGPLYVAELDMRSLVRFFAFVSNLAIDPRIVEDRGEKQDVYLWYDFDFFGDTPYIKPFIALSPTSNSRRRVNKRIQLLTYASFKLLGLGGGFDVGRIIRSEEAEEPGSYMAYLDARMRRFVRLPPREAREVGRWFTLVAAVSGLHRWGYSWRRVVASALALSIALGDGGIERGDVELLADSFAEYAFNRAVYGAVIDERYMTVEAGFRVAKMVDELRGCVSEARRAVAGGSKAGALRVVSDCFARTRRTVLDELSEDLSTLRRIVAGERPGGGMQLLGVYAEFAESVERLARAVGDEVRRGRRVAVVLTATETWSPFSLYVLGDRLSRAAGGGSARVVVFYTPQVVPQILFSLYVYKELKEGGTIKEELIDVRTDEPRCMEDQQSGSERSESVPVEFCPLVGKDAETVYHTLRAVLKGRDAVVYDPKAVGVASVLAALARLGAEHGKVRSSGSEYAEPY